MTSIHVSIRWENQKCIICLPCYNLGMFELNPEPTTKIKLHWHLSETGFYIAPTQVTVIKVLFPAQNTLGMQLSPIDRSLLVTMTSVAPFSFRGDSIGKVGDVVTPAGLGEGGPGPSCPSEPPAPLSLLSCMAPLALPLPPSSSWKMSGLVVPVELALAPSPPLWSKAILPSSSKSAISYKREKDVHY